MPVAVAPALDARTLMKIVLALGNPGSRYAATRHNIGWMVADAVAEEANAAFRPGRGDYYESRITRNGREALLVKPATYMNNSGLAARQVIERYGVSPADMLVIIDEIQFPTGRIQLKPSGSSGGHNGMESLIYHLETNEFPRLRCGIGRDFGPGEMVDYVLSRFPPHEEAVVAEMIASARDAVHTWIAEGTPRAMHQCNTPVEKRTGESPPRPSADTDDEQRG